VSFARRFLPTANHALVGAVTACKEIGNLASSDVRRYAIIGNGFAGTTAAEQLRKHDAACEITLFADEPYTLYNRISLPPMLRRQIPEAKVMIRNEAWHEEHRIDLKLRTHVERIDTGEKVQSDR
jgi:NAD(P)H-nitrite reductase large subunit